MVWASVTLIKYTLWREPQMGEELAFAYLVSIPMCFSYCKHFARVRVILVFTNTYLLSI